MIVLRIDGVVVVVIGVIAINVDSSVVGVADDVVVIRVGGVWCCCCCYYCYY